MKVVWSPRAVDRVVEVGTYIAQDSPVNARAWVERLFTHVDSQLSAFPLSGKPARDVDAEDARELVFESYRVFYDVGETVQILTLRRESEIIDSDELRSGPA